MSRAPTWLGIALLGGASACATAQPEALTPAGEADRTINTLRAQNNSYVRQIEELQNRVFILEDRLDSQRVSEQQRVTPSLPVVKALRAAPTVIPPAYDPIPPIPVEPPPSELAAADAPVEYAGEAMRTAPARPSLSAAHGASSPPRPTAVVRVRSVVPKPPVASRPPAVPAKHAPVVAARIAAPIVAAPVVTAPVVTKPVAAPPVAIKPIVAAPPVAAAISPVTVARDGTEWVEPVPAEPLRIYRDAMEALRAGHHAAALSGFRRFLDRYPVHDYADNAQYWIGECYYDLRQYQAATREFRAVIERYPHGNKVPDAMLKLGFSHLALGQTVDGRQVLDSLVRAFPKHGAAVLAAVRLTEPPFSAKANVSLGAIVPPRAGAQ